MTNVVSFSKEPPAFTYFEKGDMYGLVLEANWEMLGGEIMSRLEMAQAIEEGFHLFTDPSHYGKLLADIDIDAAGLRGCYYVVAGTFKLHKISDEPLIHNV